MKKVFLSYASKDTWVREWLVPHLEGYGIELLVDYKTFKIGPSILQNIEDAIDAADISFFVVSPNWLASEWTTLENLIIQTDSPANQKEHFFLLKLEDCDLPRRLRPFTYLDLRDAPLQASQIKRLMDQLGIPPLTASANVDAQLKKSGSDPLPLPPIPPTAMPATPEKPIKIPPLDSLEAVISFNKDNIDRLVEQLGRPNKVIPFVGAGLSASYRFKDWWGFLMHLAGQFGVTSQVKALLTKNQYEEAAQFLMDKMKPHAFHTAIEDEYGPRKLKAFHPNAVSQSLIKLTAGPVITTNYDAVIEKTFKLAEKEFELVAIGAQVSAAAKAIESHRNILFKLHGDAGESTHRILTLEEYMTHYGDVDNGRFDKDLPLPKVLHRLMGGPPLLFLGCSLQVDRTMKVLSAITNDLGHGGHYAIVELPKTRKELPGRRSELSELHIHPIWFDPKAKHGFGMVEELVRFLIGENEMSIVPSMPSPTPGPLLISTEHLPNTRNAVFGREPELAQLADAWLEANTRVRVFVAQGGEGKTSMISEFLRRMDAQNYAGAKIVFAWSFYSQGASEQTQASSTTFIRELLVALGETETATNPSLSDLSKVGKILEHIRDVPTLLILDGVEPLQHPPNHPHAGELKDTALRKLLRDLSIRSNGLCVVTTRLSLRDLEQYQGQGAIQSKLDQLDAVAGAQILKSLKVKGTKAEMELAVKDCNGHALSLTLLGTLLVQAYDEDVRKRNLIPNLMAERRLGAHANHILQDYERWMTDLPAIQLLRLLGIFDRPIEMSVIMALATKPEILGITDRLSGLTDAEWKMALADLEDLLLIHKPAPSMPPIAPNRLLDCHPLIREYFAQQLSQAHEAAFKEAHRRLYEHYKGIAKPLPDTTDEMEPLFRAMGHGCKAGLFQEALDEVFQERIQRGNEFFSVRKLGAFSSNLAAISGLFETLWQVVRGELTEGAQAFLLNSAGFCLRALGRLREAIAPFEAGQGMLIAQANWKNAAVAASNLSVLRLTIGELDKAVSDGRKAVEFADKSSVLFQMTSTRSTLADALHQAGAVAEAEALFQEADGVLLEFNAPFPRLYSFPGYQFCDLLLGKGNWEEVKERAEQTLDLSKKHLLLLDNALDHLSLGKAAHLEALATGSGDFSAAVAYLDQAVKGLKKSGYSDFVPRGLLAQAALYCDMKRYDQAEDDLDEVLEIADPEMRLFLADYHLESARLCLAMGGEHAEAQDHYAQAKQLVDETGYHRRDGELEELAQQLADSPIK